MSEQRQARMVKNKDIPLIQQIPALKQMIISLEQRRQWEESRTQKVTQSFSAVPSGGGTRRTMDDTIAAIEEISENHALQLKQYERQLRKAERIINEIRNVNMRAFVTMLYLDGVPDGAVQAVLKMSRWGFENARRCIEDAEDMASAKWTDRYCCGE